MPALGPLLGERCAALHRGHGVELRLGVSIAGLHGESGRVAAIELADGRVMRLTSRRRPRRAPARSGSRKAGSRSNGGVRCDATFTVAGHPDVLAAGDWARGRIPSQGGELIRVEHWTNAAEQGSTPGGTRCSRLPTARPSGHPVLLVRSVRDQDPVARSSPPGGPPRGRRGDGGRLPIGGRRRRQRGSGGCRRASTRLAVCPPIAACVGQPIELDSLHAEVADDEKSLGVPAGLAAMRSHRPTHRPRPREQEMTGAQPPSTSTFRTPTHFAGGPPYDAFAALRREFPVHWNPGKRADPGL